MLDRTVPRTQPSMSSYTVMFYSGKEQFCMKKIQLKSQVLFQGGGDVFILPGSFIHICMFLKEGITVLGFFLTQSQIHHHAQIFSLYPVKYKYTDVHSTFPPP
ncbi:UNVERIFIED_CONTAM: hypothetical protein K2H54_039110 [Gekko kuhli]